MLNTLVVVLTTPSQMMLNALVVVLTAPSFFRLIRSNYIKYPVSGGYTSTFPFRCSWVPSFRTSIQLDSHNFGTGHECGFNGGGREVAAHSCTAVEEGFNTVVDYCQY